MNALALGPLVEFFDFSNWSDPVQNQFVAGIGYPTSNSVILEEGRVRGVIERAVVLSPTPFGGEVLSSDKRKAFRQFDPDRHLLIPYEPAKDGKLPDGISGAAVWTESDHRHPVWSAKYRFAGICTSSYKGGTIEQVVKASVMRKFLADVLGPTADEN